MDSNILHIVERRKANCIGHILCRNCLLQQGIEGKIEVMGQQGRRHKQLLDNLKEKRGYWKLKEEALDRALENSLWNMLWTCHLTGYRMSVFSHETLCSLVENLSILMEAAHFSEMLLHVYTRLHDMS
jgi:hypothetical protein